MMVRKTIRVLAVSFAAFALLLFSTTVVSDWDCHTAADDTRCPYCHLTHQAPAPESEIALTVSLLESVASVPLAEDVCPVAAPVLSETPPRAPPTA
jgi:DNA-binding helix-hairpin-helix protein with protein kinase domain